jgi:hypothetical protein
LFEKIARGISCNPLRRCVPCFIYFHIKLQPQARIGAVTPVVTHARGLFDVSSKTEPVSIRTDGAQGAETFDREVTMKALIFWTSKSLLT